MVAMLDGRNIMKFFCMKFYYYFFPEERICIVPAIQHGRHANTPLEIKGTW